MCSYLIEIKSKEEADWISATFLENGMQMYLLKEVEMNYLNPAKQ